MVNLT
jgi:hypothetical protein